MVSARTPIEEGRVHSLQPQARRNHTTWLGQLVRPRPPRPLNSTRTSHHLPVTTHNPPRSQKTSNQRNANAILSSNTKISRLQSFLVRMKTLLILQRQKTFSLLPQSSPKPTSILTWHIRSLKPSKCTSVSPTSSLYVSNSPPLRRLDTQGLLDRVFPLSEDQPDSSCSLRTLLQDSPSRSLRALRVLTTPTLRSSQTNRHVYLGCHQTPLSNIS